MCVFMGKNKKLIKKNNFLLDLSSPIVMGILNSTPDSFHSNSRNVTESEILHRAEVILREGGKIIDIGGYSTRPTADFVSQEEEIRRVSFAVELVIRNFPEAVISVDTFRSDVARHVCKNYNVPVINDVSGGTLDDKMFETVAELGVTYILMHMRGTPQTMQTLTGYDDLLADILYFFERRIACLHRLGVKDIVIDPGFGFAKNIEQNYLLLKKMTYFEVLNTPILVGVSRKSMIQKVLSANSEESLNGTTAVNMIALLNNASILRVHDVKEAVEAVKIFEQYINAN